MIAVYMGYKKKARMFYIPEFEELQEVNMGECDTVCHFYLEEMKFKIDWNWLMPVVRKILFGAYPLGGIKLMSAIDKDLTTCDIGKVYRSVIKFLEWNRFGR